MRISSAICYIDSSENFVNAVVLHTSKRTVIPIEILSDKYTDMYDLIHSIVKSASVQGFYIPYYDCFRGRCYDVIIVDAVSPFSIGKRMIPLAEC